MNEWNTPTPPGNLDALPPVGAWEPEAPSLSMPNEEHGLLGLSDKTAALWAGGLGLAEALGIAPEGAAGGIVSRYAQGFTTGRARRVDEERKEAALKLQRERFAEQARQHRLNLLDKGTARRQTWDLAVKKILEGRHDKILQMLPTFSREFGPEYAGVFVDAMRLWASTGDKTAPLPLLPHPGGVLPKVEDGALPMEPSYRFPPESAAGQKERKAYRDSVQAALDRQRHDRNAQLLPHEVRGKVIANKTAETRHSIAKNKEQRDQTLFPLIVEDKKAHAKAAKQLMGYREAMRGLAARRQDLAEQKAQGGTGSALAGVPDGKAVAYTPALAQKASGYLGQDFGPRGCARFVGRVLNDSGITVSSATASVPVLARELVKNHKARTEMDPSRFAPGDIIIQPSSSAPSGYHAGIYSGGMKMLANPGAAGDTKVRVQAIGSGAVAYQLRPKGARGFRKSGEKPGPAFVENAKTMQDLQKPKPAGKGLDATTYTRLQSHLARNGKEISVAELRATDEWKMAKSAQRQALETIVRGGK